LARKKKEVVVGKRERKKKGRPSKRWRRERIRNAEDSAQTGRVGAGKRGVGKAFEFN